MLHHISTVQALLIKTHNTKLVDFRKINTISIGNRCILGFKRNGSLNTAFLSEESWYVGEYSSMKRCRTEIYSNIYAKYCPFAEPTLHEFVHPSRAIIDLLTETDSNLLQVNYSEVPVRCLHTAALISSILSDDIQHQLHRPHITSEQWNNATPQDSPPESRVSWDRFCNRGHVLR